MSRLPLPGVSQQLKDSFWRCLTLRSTGRHAVKVFHHVPRCGGTSLRKVLESWFIVIEDYRLGWSNVWPAPVELGTLDSRHCVCGHFELEGYHLFERYPTIRRASRKFFLFTFVRDPLEMAISLYQYARKNGTPKGSRPLEQQLVRAPNPIARLLNVSESDYEQRLNDYHFIGVFEEFEQSVRRLAGLLGKKPVPVPQINGSDRSSKELAFQLPAALVKEFRRLNQLDYRIYDFARKRLHGAVA